MDAVSAGNYDSVKEAIFARYDLTADAYRRKFRASRKQPDETFHEWAVRARRYFERWVSAALGDPERLAETIIIEHILTNTSPDLQVRLRERSPKTVKEVTDMAESHRSARQGSYSGKEIKDGKESKENKFRGKWKPRNEERSSQGENKSSPLLCINIIY